MKKLKKYIEEYNKFHSPEAKAELIEIKGNKFIIKFSGHYCFTCGAREYFEDLVYLLKERGMKTKIINIEESSENENIVEFEIIHSVNDFYEIIKEINRLRNTEVKKLVEKRMKEFEKIGESPPYRIFSELCFCILTANFNAERAVKIQEEIGNGFISLSEQKLARKLMNLGHRYPNMRAKYIVEARKKLDELMRILRNKNKNENEKREWLVKNIKGLGYKEASHFLRNIGYKNCAILDFHILDLLIEIGIIKNKPKSLTKRKYLEIETILKKIAKKANLTLGELDLYLWYLETGKIVK